MGSGVSPSSALPAPKCPRHQRVTRLPEPRLAHAQHPAVVPSHPCGKVRPGDPGSTAPPHPTPTPVVQGACADARCRSSLEVSLPGHAARGVSQPLGGALRRCRVSPPGPWGVVLPFPGGAQRPAAPRSQHRRRHPTCPPSLGRWGTAAGAVDCDIRTVLFPEVVGDRGAGMRGAAKHTGLPARIGVAGRSGQHRGLCADRRPEVIVSSQGSLPRH